MFPGPGYWELRSIWVAAFLDDLTGPSTGTVEPLPGIQGPTRRPVHLDNLAEVAAWYAATMREALSEQDLSQMNGEVLVRIWPELFLPPRVRWAWESRFSELR